MFNNYECSNKFTWSLYTIAQPFIDFIPYSHFIRLHQAENNHIEVVRHNKNQQYFLIFHERQIQILISFNKSIHA